MFTFNFVVIPIKNGENSNMAAIPLCKVPLARIKPGMPITSALGTPGVVVKVDHDQALEQGNPFIVFKCEGDDELHGHWYSLMTAVKTR